MSLPDRKTCCLVHTGRKSGKTFNVTIWFVEIDGEPWIGSLDETRGWVRNLRAQGRCEIDFGAGPAAWLCREIRDPASIERFRSAILVKYPVAGRLLRLFVRGGRQVAFRLVAAEHAEGFRDGDR